MWHPTQSERSHSGRVRTEFHLLDGGIGGGGFYGDEMRLGVEEERLHNCRRKEGKERKGKEGGREVTALFECCAVLQ